MTNITLPPLPYGAMFAGRNEWSDYQMRAYATAAVLADREKRGEPVAWQWLTTGHFRKKLPRGARVNEWRPLYLAPQPVEQRKPLTEAAMTDRELLELAAKAINGTIYVDKPTGNVVLIPTGAITGVVWNPLEHDDDAFRLAVKLRLELDISNTGVECRTADGFKVLIEAENEPDAYAATRRAIVRATAEIGRAML